MLVRHAAVGRAMARPVATAVFGTRRCCSERTATQAAIGDGTPIHAFFEHGNSAPATPLGAGCVTRQIAGSVHAVALPHICLSPIVEVGSRVHIRYPGETAAAPDTFIGGLVVKVNGSGTFAVLLDNNRFDLAVPPELVCLAEGRARYINNPAYEQVVEWIRTAGVVRRIDQESMACILFQRGWRVEKLYLLEGADVHCMTHIPKSVRMCVLDKSEWQRDHHRQMRQLLKERVKERDFRYRLTKYSGVVSASMAFLGIAFAFGWNVKNHRRQQRKFQLALALKALHRTLKPHSAAEAVHTASRPGAETGQRHVVHREAEEEAVQRVLRQLDTAHPRIIVLTGYAGCGKSSVCRAAIEKEGMPALYVDIRGPEDTLRSVVKALGVQNIEVCGDLLDFVAISCQRFTELTARTPLLVLKLRDGSDFKKVYNEAVALACDRRLCHLVLEVPLESLTMANTSLPRLDFYTVPNFTPAQAYEYTQHSIDPVSLAHFIDVAGTNSNDLDELFAAVHQRRVSAMEYTNQKMLKAMRQLQSAWAGNEELRTAVRHLARFPFETGQHTGIDVTSLHSTALRDIALYDSVRDVWLFKNKIFHTAARCCRGEEVS